jgi:hypothetical protein
MKFWTAVSLVNAGRLTESLPLFKAVFEQDPDWLELTPRLTNVDLLKVDHKELKLILSQSPQK